MGTAVGVKVGEDAPSFSKLINVTLASDPARALQPHLDYPRNLPLVYDEIVFQER